MGKDSISIEEIFLVAQGSLNDFPIIGKFLIKSIVEKYNIHNNETHLYKELFEDVSKILHNPNEFFETEIFKDFRELGLIFI